MIYVLWCAVCHNVRVDRSGDACVRCIASWDADLEGRITHNPPTPTAPFLVRVRDWIAGRTAT